jgi:hypothetical protein
LKTLPAGTPKYLLIDLKEVARNAERSKPGTPVAQVLIPDEKVGFEVIKGYAVYADGPVTLAYNQRGPLIRRGRDIVHAAYYTEAEVRIAEERDEDLTRPATTTKRSQK